MSDALSALLHPFAQGQLALPAPNRGFFIQARFGPELDDPWKSALLCEQAFKPECDRLDAHGFQMATELPERRFDLGLCLLGKYKAENLANLGRAWRLLVPGGTMVFAGGKDVGAAAVEATLRNLHPEVSSLSKHHCRVFWVRRDREVPELEALAEQGRLRLVADTGYYSRPGLYNWDKVDAGSRLLADHLPTGLDGRVADLGAGWGYLSARLLAGFPDIAALDLFEADWRALEAAKANLARVASGARMGFHWHDVAAGLPAGAFDAVVMNPPCHSGKATDIALGQSFIAAAATALVPGGRLYMVANRQLPYEPVLKQAFSRFRPLAATGVYKVIEAER